MNRESVIAEATGGLQILQPKVKSRPVEAKDLWRVFWASLRIKLAMRHPFPGRWPKAASISHCQVEANDPLRFFVVDRFGLDKLKWFFGARTIINPEILETHGSLVKNREACMSYPFTKQVGRKRHEIVLCRYWTFFGRKTRKLYLERAYVVQHELEHMNLDPIVDKKFGRDD